MPTQPTTDPEPAKPGNLTSLSLRLAAAHQALTERLSTRALLGSAALLVIGLAALGNWAYGVATVPNCPDDVVCPEVGSLDEFTGSEAPHMFDVSGNLVAHLPGRVRIWTPLDRFPELLRDGLVAVEDARFHEHGGVDAVAVARASVANMRAGSVQEGASTLTMQLARTLWAPGLQGTNRWVRKLREVRLSRAMEAEWTKEQILEQYMNEVYMGEGLYGFGAASVHYFRTEPLGLSPVQMATLVGMVKTPGRYNPRKNPELSQERRQVVLSVWRAQGLIDASEQRRWADAELPLVDRRPVRQGESYPASFVLRELRDLLPDPADRVGVRVTTTFDARAQEAAEAAVTAHLEGLEQSGGYPHASPDGALEAGVSASPYLQAAGVVLDVETGAMRALVGGRSHGHSEFDRATQAQRQTGSAFKPLVYALAFANGSLTLADRIGLDTINWTDDDGEVWSPRDPLASEYEDLSVREAIAKSSNLAAVRVGLDVGLRRVVTQARDFGIDGELAPYPATLLGAAALTPLEMASAYAVFANGGSAIQPYSIERIEDRHGAVLYERTPQRAQALDPRAAYLTRRALEGVIDGGTGWRVRRAGLEGRALGKTGTSNDAQDLWFVGATPEVSAAVWVGFDQPQPILGGRASASRHAAPLWGALVQGTVAHREGVRTAWPRRPERMVAVEIDPRTGKRPSELCPAARPVTEWFIPGTEPGTACEIDLRRGSPAGAAVERAVRIAAPQRIAPVGLARRSGGETESMPAVADTARPGG